MLSTADAISQSAATKNEITTTTKARKIFASAFGIEFPDFIGYVFEDSLFVF